MKKLSALCFIIIITITTMPIANAIIIDYSISGQLTGMPIDYRDGPFIDVLGLDGGLMELSFIVGSEDEIPQTGYQAARAYSASYPALTLTRANGDTLRRFYPSVMDVFFIDDFPFDRISIHEEGDCLDCSPEFRAPFEGVRDIFLSMDIHFPRDTFDPTTIGPFPFVNEDRGRNTNPDLGTGTFYLGVFSDEAPWGIEYRADRDAFFASAKAVPEPTTMLLLGAGLVGLAGFGRKKIFKDD